MTTLAPSPRESESPQGGGTVESPVEKRRSRKVYVLWGVALVVLIAAGLFSWLVVVPVWRVHRQVLAFSRFKDAGKDAGWEASQPALAALGSRTRARKDLLLYLRFPGFPTRPEHRKAAERLLAYSLTSCREEYLDAEVFLWVISPDGRKMVTCELLSCTVWDLESGREVCILRGGRYEHQREIAWSPDSRYVAGGSGFVLGSYTSEATVWNAATGKDVLHVAPTDDVGFVAFSPDGKLLFTAGYMRWKPGLSVICDKPTARVFIWNVSTGKSVCQLQIQKLNELDSLSRVSFSADSSTVHLVMKKEARTFSCRTGKEITQPGGPKQESGQ